ncbi:MAG: MFS transporter [Armatimonadota bacterium]|nr:MFS transporter [Armatimonadota bacterium]
MRDAPVSAPGAGSRMWVRGFVALCVGQFLGHQTGLVFSALIPVLGTAWGLSAAQAGVILGGFQLGTLAAYVTIGFLLDRVQSKPIMAASAALVGIGDLAFAAAARDFPSGLALRMLVGVLVGGLYLPALKQIADTVPRASRGSATGIFIATIVAAYALPLVYAGVLVPRIGWRATMAAVGVLEVLGALVMAWQVPAVPLPAPPGPAALSRYARDVLGNAPARRVILAYTGHNWELFGLWTWLAPFMVASLQARGEADRAVLAWGGLMAAAAIGAGGALGAVAGGRLSDRLGRMPAARVMLAVSLVCSLCFGWLVAAPVALTAGVALLYGTVSLADSPSYPAALMEVVPARSLGGAFAVQMLLGWAATAASPAAVGLTLDAGTRLGLPAAARWGWAFALLAAGPLVGLVALAPARPRRAAGTSPAAAPATGEETGGG